MFNIQKAVSRLDYAPKLKEIEITDIKKGLGVFVPKPDKAVSYAALKQTLKKAGYTLDTADITIAGKIVKEGENWFIVADTSGQKFSLEGKTLNDLTADSMVEINGIWKTSGEGAAAREVVDPQSVKKIEDDSKANTVSRINEKIVPRESFVRFTNANFVRPSITPAETESKEDQKTLAPIRTTSPGLTVYQGGAFTPRFYFIRQHLGDLDVTRQVLDLSLSYTPTPRLQLEIEVPISRTTFDDGVNSDSGSGLGNITLWGKYRFFRTVKTYGDRQTSFRFGMELPTGKKSAPTAQAVNASEFVRQQLTPISGGFAPHFDIAFSQAGGRFIFGGNIEGIVRTTRDGFRMGNELRANTDFEYVLLPFDYQKPGKELFVILETSFVVRGRGKLNDQTVADSKSTEFYIAPGLQYAAHPQFVIEGSVQIPVFRNAGREVLRNDLNLLLGIKYLF